MKAAPSCSIAALMSGTSCSLSPENERATKVAPSCSAIATRSIELSVLIDAALRFRAAVGGGGELALGEAVHAVVLDDVDHVDAAPHGVRELAEPDGGGVAVARDAEIDQFAVGEIGAGQHRRHAAVHGVEAVRLAEEIVGVFEEQPMPESFATRCGWIASSKQASMIAAVIESWPQPAQSVETLPS